MGGGVDIAQRDAVQVAQPSVLEISAIIFEREQVLPTQGNKNDLSC